MARVKRGVTANKRRKNVLKQAKGFKWGRKTKYKLAKDALAHAGVYSFRDRKAKKRVFRKLWQVQISAALGDMISYSKFIAELKKNNIEIDRKILSQLGKTRPETFKKIVEKIKS
ncbi:MAG TPA: 50S ribosomal protein L20 [candidate division CPR3 bacterium]|uniref:Large ribosomal subunit protein bL20 n=1 Tax=candidate division CPR3 bacterium TaxID=2268181 RepID=A0A7C1P599_UNCC3|nr:50S ribosomal protein L20 [candidate division CPR3 bacterium]